MGCDTLAALPAATRDRTTLFAKNSDRPPEECQRIVQLPRREHGRGARVRCQYLEVPQARETAGVLGSQPYWLWGLEHGVNEHRVAIGNETVFTREPPGDTGLLGMDLVRLGLERGRTATEALDVMTALIERHGQGGSGWAHVHFPYNNGFLIADPTSAWILETSGRQWAARRVIDVANVSNRLSIGTDWDRTSADAAAFAVSSGWSPPGASRFDFRAAYVDESGAPPNLSEGRWRRGAALLARGRGALTVSGMRAILRDHYDTGEMHRPRPFDDPCFFELCMHGEPLDNTTASMVVHLPADPAARVTAWISLGNPCVGAFLPCYPDARVPPRLADGGARRGDGPWWLMRGLLERVAQDFAVRGPIVRARWDEFEDALDRESTTIEAEAARRSPSEASALLAAFMERTVDGYLRTSRELIAELAEG